MQHRVAGDLGWQWNNKIGKQKQTPKKRLNKSKDKKKASELEKGEKCREKKCRNMSHVKNIYDQFPHGEMGMAKAKDKI